MPENLQPPMNYDQKGGENNLKKILSLILALLLCLGLAAPALASGSDSGITVIVNGKSVAWPDAGPFVDENGRTMAPLRAVAEALGLKVVWYAAQREAAFTDGCKVICFPIGSTTASVSGGGSLKMDTAAVIVNDRTYAPARYLAEYFGYTVDWDDPSNTVTISKGSSEDFVCGETEPHDWKAANYQAPKTCAVCGATQGGALTPDFAARGIKADMELGKNYYYETLCYNDRTLRTVGYFTVLDYSVFKSDAVHKAKDGYEWRSAAFQLLSNDANTRRYSIYPATPREDYYDIRLNDDSVMYNGSGDTATFTVNYYGEDRECFFLLESPTSEWQGDTFKLSFRVTVRVPVGYDGFVFGVRNAAVDWPDGAYIFDIYDPYAFLLFRFS